MHGKESDRENGDEGSELHFGGSVMMSRRVDRDKRLRRAFSFLQRLGASFYAFTGDAC